MAFDRRQFIEKAKKGVQRAYSRKDAQIIQAVRSLDDIDEAKSLLFQRLDEWFKINFPEFSLGNEESFARVVAEFGSKEDLDFNGLAAVTNEAKATEIMSLAEKSFGSPFDIEDRKAVQALAARVVELCEARKKLEDYLRVRVRENMKNLCAFADELLIARLLSLAGSLERLAEMPASTIQVIGAEKALFKHLRAGTRPPKHGVIFQSTIVNSAPLDKRGKLARALAAKLSIAAKADYFKGDYIMEKVKADFEKRLKQIAGLPHRDIKPFVRPDDRRGGFRGGGFRQGGGFRKGGFQPGKGGKRFFKR